MLIVPYTTVQRKFLHISHVQAIVLSATSEKQVNPAVAQITAKVDEVCADGTVTKDEAEAVHELSRSLLHHHKD